MKKIKYIFKIYNKYIWKISVCCITKNEEVHIERLIQNINDIAEEIIVVDSFSTDNTIKILEKYNCKIFKRKFDNFSNQKNYCLSKVSDNSEWVLFIDADELLTQELKNEILTIENKTYDAYEIQKKILIGKINGLKEGIILVGF